MILLSRFALILIWSELVWIGWKKLIECGKWINGWLCVSGGGRSLKIQCPWIWIRRRELCMRLHLVHPMVQWRSLITSSAQILCLIFRGRKNRGTFWRMVKLVCLGGILLWYPGICGCRHSSGECYRENFTPYPLLLFKYPTLVWLKIVI